MTTKINEKNAEKIGKCIKKFSCLMTGAVESLENAARVYADAIDKYGDEAHYAFKDAFPSVTAATWDKLRLVAKQSIVPELLLLSDRIGARIARLPISTQRKMLSGVKRVTVVTPSGRTTEKALAQLTPEEEARVFGETGKMRTKSEQLRYIAERATKRQVCAAYDIEGNVLVVHRATRIGKAELLDIVKRMGR